ncbi:MAG TPA: hypothetical protein VH142_24360, partial [Polyangiaceae bacterium]|nr:hypothetical protein [Polyangiaceae bacterium]
MIERPGKRHWDPVSMREPAYDLSGGSSGVVIEPSMNPSAADTPREEDELRALVKAHFSFIWRSLRRLGVAANDADDAAQRVFWVASQRLADIEAGKERAFLFGTATLIAHEFRRAGKRRPEVAETDVDVPDGGPTLDELVDRRRARALLDDVLDRMPMEQ